MNQKKEILHSLSSLDSAQAEKVLSYIKVLLSSQRSEFHHQILKRRAMKEIGQALGKVQQFNSSF